MQKKRPIIGITMGDPVGIGPEIIASVLNDPKVYEICRPLIIGDLFIMKKAFKLKRSNLSINSAVSPGSGLYKFGTADILSLSNLNEDDATPAKPNTKTGKAMLNYIEKAVDLAMDKKISAMVTCPITKTAMKMAGSKFHGHTELIAERTGTREYAMMLAGDKLKVVLVTIHIPLSEVSQKISKEKIVKTISITANSLKTRFGIKKPVIAVAGLNPHAGEDSMFGPEEAKIIKPAVKQALNEGFDVEGPFPPDTLFYHAANGKYHGVVCMYHDQGLIPFKMIHFNDGVNTTLGLPIIRTSVDHGTAYDIAWKGIADSSSLMASIKMAVLQANTMIK